ncbi:MAG: hypothetical protein K5650_07830 [Bacteroidales bacterium]|nr:hypothetical protein [Bacteroidales bacterium]
MEVLPSKSAAFFCGDSLSGTPFFGFFYYSSFATGSVQYDIFPLTPTFNTAKIVKLNKMEVFVTPTDDVHVIMTGECVYPTDTTVRRGCIIDAYTTTMMNPSWNIEVYAENKWYMLFDDVAVSNNYVAVSARYQIYQQNACVCFFSRPTSGSTSIFSIPRPTPDVLRGDRSAFESTAIEHCTGDWFVTAYTTQYGSVSDGLVVSAYHGPNNVYKKIVDLSSAPVSHVGPPKDMAYLNRQLHVLQDYSSSGTTYNGIFKFSPYHAYNPTGTDTIKYHNPANNIVKSLDRKPIDPLSVAVSGLNSSGNLFLGTDVSCISTACLLTWTFSYSSMPLDNPFTENLTAIRETVRVDYYTESVKVSTITLTCS